MANKETQNINTLKRPYTDFFLNYESHRDVVFS